MLSVQIVSTGFYAPERVETAAELARRIGRSESWIARRAGVLRRHIAEEPVEHMAAKAAREALGSGPAPDLLIYAATTPRQMIPDTSTFVARELGFEGLTTFTLHATCLSFMPALWTAATLITSGGYRRVLIVSAEIGSVARNVHEPESASLLGDGAAAAVLEATPSGEASEMLALAITTHPAGAELTQLPGGGMHRHPLDPNTTAADYLFTMNGPAVYRMARPRLEAQVRDVLRRAGCAGIADIDLVVPHQASGRALDSMAEHLGVPAARVVNIIAEYGNCVAASLPMALAHANRTGRLVRGQRVMLIGTGAGLAVGTLILRW
ncbi:MAG: ketoacyl-ACP synthase III [bacterium]